MIVNNMSFAEIAAEAAKDWHYLHRVMALFNSESRRTVVKAKSFPIVFKPVERNSPRKNKWYLIAEAPDKASTMKKGVLMRFITLINTAEGYYVLQPVQGNQYFEYYTPHFFSRYAERNKVNLTGKELVFHYFQNIKKAAVTEREKAIFVTTAVGVGLGYKIDNIFFYKTFISSEMLKGKQIDNFIKAEKEIEARSGEVNYIKTVLAIK